MKKVLLSLALGFATTIAFAQIEAGTKILGGELSYTSVDNKSEVTNNNTTTTTTVKSSSMSLIPSFGYMFQDNLGAGLRLGIQNSSSGDETTNAGKDETNITIVGLFGRYYLPVAGDKMFFHADLILDFGFGKDKNTQTDNQGVKTTTEADLNTMAFGIQPGWDFFVGDKWAIEMNWGWLGYTSESRKTSAVTNTETEFGLKFDFTSFGLGARWYF